MSRTTGHRPLPPSIEALTSMRSQARPITADERRRRIERARKLMAEQKIDALMLCSGTSLVYFTNIEWSGGERLFTCVIPARGEPFFVCPAFEEDRAREQIALGPFTGSADVRTWHEHESPYELVAVGLRDRGIATGQARHGRDRQVRFQRRRRARRAWRQRRERHPGDRRLPHDQGRPRARADASRVHSDPQGLRGSLQGADGGHDAERLRPAGIDGTRAARILRGRRRSDRQVLGAASRLDPAAGRPRRDDPVDRRRMRG